MRALALVLLLGALTTAACAAPPAGRVSSAASTPAHPCACERASGCAVEEELPLGGAAAADWGLGIDEDGGIRCDPEALHCRDLGPAEGARLVRVSERCGLWGEAFLRTADRIYLRVPQSIGEQGGPGWALSPVEGAEAASFRPIGMGFARDRRAVFDHGRHVPDLDPESFSALRCPGRCLGCDAERCLMECEGHPLQRPSFCWSEPP